MGTMSQQKRPHKRYTPKFFHCDDVPRQTTSSDMPELVSVTENSFSNECRPHQAGKHTERVLEQRGERDSRVRVRVAIAWSARWLAVYAMSGSKAMASKLARIDHHTADYHLKEDRGFAAQAEAAKAHAIDLLHTRCMQRALEGDMEPVYWQGILVDHVRKFDNRLQIEMLRAHMPATFKTPGEALTNIETGDKMLVNG